jgi:hypothetical protein
MSTRRLAVATAAYGIRAVAPPIEEQVDPRFQEPAYANSAE